MGASVTRKLVLAAALFDGILASGNINRAFVDMPAWRAVGAQGWAHFSRHADLGRHAMVLYPLEAFAGMLLSVAAILAFHREDAPSEGDKFPLYAAALAALGGLLITMKAAPIMLSIRHLGEDTAALQHALDGFELWGGIRGIFQVLAYIFNLWSLFAVLKCESPGATKI